MLKLKLNDGKHPYKGLPTKCVGRSFKMKFEAKTVIVTWYHSNQQTMLTKPGECLNFYTNVTPLMQIMHTNC